MSYKFPRITHIDEVLLAIEGRDEFSVTDKGEYTTINYHIVKQDTFPPVNVPINPMAIGGHKGIVAYDYLAAVRRECRGIIFSNDNGRIIRRPLHKFFNFNEIEETCIENINFTSKSSFQTKRDGSMIAPFKLSTGIHFGTKAGITEVSKPVDEFVSYNLKYYYFAEYCIENGYTPIFEWTSRKQRIILDYPQDELTLLAIRHMETGEYINFVRESNFIDPEDFEGDLSKIIEKVDEETPEDKELFLIRISQMTNIEGFVQTWEDGSKLKIKTDDYVKVHRAKDALSSENKILELYFDNQLDDLLAALFKPEQEAIREFCARFEGFMEWLSISLTDVLHDHKDLSRKDFALRVAPSFNSYLKPVLFACFDNPSVENTKQQLYKMVKKNIIRNCLYDDMKAYLFPDLKLEV